MKQDHISQAEFEARVKKQQTLMRKLFASRKRREEEIREAINERYGHLIGKFIDCQLQGKVYACITELKAGFRNNQFGEVFICLICNYPALTMRNVNGKEVTYGVAIDSYTEARFDITDSIDTILADRFVSKERVVVRFNEIGAEIGRVYGLK